MPSPIPNLISGLTAHAAPLSLAASLAVAAVAAFGRRKSGGKRLVGTGAAVSLVPVATASGEPAWRDASQSPPVPPLDIAGDAFSDFVSGKAVGDVIIRKTDSHSQSKSETSPRANRLFDEARAGGTTQNKAATGKATQVPSPIPNLISGLTAHAAPLSLAASLAVAAVAAFGRRKSGGKRLVGTGAAVSLVPVATASGEPAWRDASQSPPVPPLDIAGDAFSDFVSGKAVGDVIIRKTDLKSTIDFGKPPTFPASPEQLRTELASLEKDLEAYEALLLSGGKALAKAERSRTGGTKREKTQTHTDGTDSENSQTFKSLVRKQKRKDAPPAPASASKAWWDVDIDQRNYRPAFAVSTQLFSSSTIHKNEKRAKARKEQRLRYFRTNVTVRAASGATAQRAETDLLRRLAPNSPLDARVFDSHEIGATSYGVALAALCKEQNLGDVRGEGTFSDVYATFPADPVLSRSKPGDWSYVGTTLGAQGTAAAILPHQRHGAGGVRCHGAEGGD